MTYQLCAGKLAKRWLMAISVVTLMVTFFAVLEVEASDGIQFNANDHAGKFVDMGGRKWVVLDVIDGKPYLMMDSVYADRAWNRDGGSSDASDIFQYLQDEFDHIITVAEHRDLIADTTWRIYSLDFDDLNTERDESPKGKGQVLNVV